MKQNFLQIINNVFFNEPFPMIWTKKYDVNSETKNLIYCEKKRWSRQRFACRCSKKRWCVDLGGSWNFLLSQSHCKEIKNWIGLINNSLTKIVKHLSIKYFMFLEKNCEDRDFTFEFSFLSQIDFKSLFCCFLQNVALAGWNICWKIWSMNLCSNFFSKKKEMKFQKIVFKIKRISNFKPRTLTSKFSNGTTLFIRFVISLSIIFSHPLVSSKRETDFCKTGSFNFGISWDNFFFIM